LDLGVLSGISADSILIWLSDLRAAAHTRVGIEAKGAAPCFLSYS
jgi:hypothetical protein